MKRIINFYNEDGEFSFGDTFDTDLAENQVKDIAIEISNDLDNSETGWTYEEFIKALHNKDIKISKEKVETYEIWLE